MNGSTLECFRGCSCNLRLLLFGQVGEEDVAAGAKEYEEQEAQGCLYKTVHVQDNVGESSGKVRSGRLTLERVRCSDGRSYYRRYKVRSGVAVSAVKARRFIR